MPVGSSALSTTGDPLILIAYPQTQRGKKINSTALFHHHPHA